MAVRAGAARLTAGIALSLSFIAAPAEAGPTVPIAVGDYKAAPVVEDGGTYSTGLFSIAKESGRRSLVPTDGFDAVFYPDIGKCDELQLPLLAGSVPVKPNGRFRIREATPVEDGTVVVDWKGHWTKAKRVSGSITIAYDGCTSTVGWSGRRVPPSTP